MRVILTECVYSYTFYFLREAAVSDSSSRETDSQSSVLLDGLLEGHL